MAKRPITKKVTLANMNPAARAARIKVLSANPGTRSSIPDRFLPSQYKASRAHAQQMKQENATLYNPAQILSGKDLRSAVNSEVNLQLNPKLGAYDREIGSLTSARNVSAARLGQYSDMYNKATAASAANISSSGQQLAEKLAQIGQGTQDTLSNIQSGITQRNAADTAVRGAGLQDISGAQGAVDFNKAQAAGATQSAIELGAGQAGGLNTLAGTIAATAPMRANEQQFILANKFNSQIADMMGKRADLAASRGDLTAQTLNKMRQDQFTNLATAKGLNLKQADLNETVRKNKATEKLTGLAINQRNLASLRTASTASEKLTATKAYQKAQLDIKRGIDPITGKKLPGKPQSAADALSAWKLDFARKHGYLPSTGAKSGHATEARTTKMQTDYSAVSQAISNAKADFPGDRKRGGTGAIKAIIGEKPTTDPLMASIAADMAYDGHISRANTIKLKKRGINVADLGGVVSYSDWLRKNKNKSNPRGGGKRRVASGAFPPIVLP